MEYSVSFDKFRAPSGAFIFKEITVDKEDSSACRLYRIKYWRAKRRTEAVVLLHYD